MMNFVLTYSDSAKLSLTLYYTYTVWNFLPTNSEEISPTGSRLVQSASRGLKNNFINAF